MSKATRRLAADFQKESSTQDIMIHMACNDPNNGNFAGRVLAMRFGEALTVERYFDRGIKLRDTGSKIVLGGMGFPYSGGADWVGNWCWNGYWVSYSTAGEMFLWLAKRDWFQAEEGETRLFSIWQNKGETWLDPVMLGLLIGKFAEVSNDR